jgi:hypothetical protein
MHAKDRGMSGEVAATAAMELRRDMETLYFQLTNIEGFGSKKLDQFPHQSDTTPFFFLRTFVPYYYHRFHASFKQRIEEQQNLFDPAYTGLCAGDAHCDNFGISYNSSNDAVMSINDFDDAGHTYFYAELVRFITSCVLKQQDIRDSSSSPSPSPDDQANFILSLVAAYCDGFHQTNDPRSTSGFERPDDWDAYEESEDGQTVNSTMLETLTDAIRSIYNDLSITLDRAVETTKSDGGSGCLKRYEVSFHLPLDSHKRESMTLQLKQEVSPGLLPLYYPLGAVPPAASQRIPIAMNWELGDSTSNGWTPRISHTTVPLYSVIQMRTTNTNDDPGDYRNIVPSGVYTFLVRPALKGFKKAPKVYKKHLFVSEATLLGYLHAHQPQQVVLDLSPYAQRLLLHQR